MNEIGKVRKQKVEAFTAELNALLKRHGLRMWGDDDGDLELQETDTDVGLGWLEYNHDNKEWAAEFRQEAIDPEGYAAARDLATVPMPAKQPAEYEAWKQRHPAEAELFEHAVEAGHYATPPSEQFPFTTTAPAQQAYQEQQDFYRGGTRSLSSEDMGYHGVNWTWLGGRVAGERGASIVFGGTPDPKEYRP